MEEYTGETQIEPTTETQVLHTTDKILNENIVVLPPKFNLEENGGGGYSVEIS